MARCPNCTESLHRGADGDYPPQCPKCGVRIRSKAKKTAVTTSQAASAPPSTEERVVRSFSARQQNSTAPANAFERPIPQMEETEGPAEEPANPFIAPPQDAERSQFAAAFEENPFAPPPTSAAVAAKKSLEAVNPFGASEVAPPTRKGPRTGVVKAVVAGVLVAACGGIGAWFGKDLFSKPAARERTGYRNPGHHYIFYNLPTPWIEDAKRANIAGFDFALHRADLGGWVTLRSELVKDDAVDWKEVAEQVGQKWKERISDFKTDERLGKMKLGQGEAVVVDGEGTLDGKPVRGKSLVLVAGGVKYVMGFEGPVEAWDKLERDFALARNSLELTGGSADPVKMLGENETARFESKKLPYRLTTPAGAWREVPDLQTDSRFDDLKLQDKSRLGEVVVAARETKDLPGMRVRYVETQTRRYENRVRELEGSIEKLTIRGRPAMRTILIVTNAGGDFMLYTTFVQSDGTVFQIQCRAPVEKRDAYEPIFSKIADSFEILAKAPEAVKAPEKAVEPTKAAPAKNSIPAPEKGMKKGDEPAKPQAKDLSKAESDQKPKPEKTAEMPKKADVAKKKKSLDDLD